MKVTTESSRRRCNRDKDDSGFIQTVNKLGWFLTVCEVNRGTWHDLQNARSRSTLIGFREPVIWKNSEGTTTVANDTLQHSSHLFKNANDETCEEEWNSDDVTVSTCQMQQLLTSVYQCHHRSCFDWREARFIPYSHTSNKMNNTRLCTLSIALFLLLSFGGSFILPGEIEFLNGDFKGIVETFEHGKVPLLFSPFFSASC